MIENDYFFQIKNYMYFVLHVTYSDAHTQSEIYSAWAQNDFFYIMDTYNFPRLRIQSKQIQYGLHDKLQGNLEGLN